MSLLNTVAASATTRYLVSHRGGRALAAAAVHGYTTAFSISAALLAAAAVVALALLRAGRSDVPDDLGVLPA